MRAVLICLFLLALPACRTIGPKAIRDAYPRYNNAVREVVDQELLLNIVRVRYLDPIQFMTIGTVSAQFSVEMSGGFEGGIDQELTSALGSGGLTYRDAPTLTFTPRHDTRFTKLLTQPISISTFAGLTAGPNGWSWALLLAATSINGAQGSLFGGQQARFDRRMEILGDLQKNDHVSVGRGMYTYPISEPLPRSTLTPTHLILAAENGYRFQGAGDGEVQLVAREQSPALRVRRSALESLATELEALGLDKAAGTYMIRSPVEMGKLVHDSEVLHIGTRPFLGVMRVMAAGVEPPAEHRRAGVVDDAILAGVPSRIKSVFRVHSSCERPCARLAVRHRGYWFYIDDADSKSRSAFLMLTTLYGLELGIDGEKKKGPVLTLPLGG